MDAKSLLTAYRIDGKVFAVSNDGETMRWDGKAWVPAPEADAGDPFSPDALGLSRSEMSALGLL